jgi:hypothetical protein
VTILEQEANFYLNTSKFISPCLTHVVKTTPCSGYIRPSSGGWNILERNITIHKRIQNIRIINFLRKAKINIMLRLICIGHKNVKLSLCLICSAICHEGVWGS